MPRISKQIRIHHSAEKVFAFLRQFKKFPQFIDGVKRVDSLSSSHESSVSSWVISISDTEISWRQLDSFDSKNLTINFKLIDGDFADYAGSLAVRSIGQSSIITFDFVIEWSSESPTDAIGFVLEQKAMLASMWMLRKIREAINSASRVGEIDSGIVREGLVSHEFMLTNSAGNRIVGYLDQIEDSSSGKHVVIVPPGYGETKRDALSLAYYLASNGFVVLRYDATNHIGESDGLPVDTTMDSFRIDMLAVIDYAAKIFPQSKLALVSSSLSKRVAVRVAAEDPRVRLLVSVVGVVNLRDTLQAVYQEDMIGSRLSGKSWGVTDVLGIKVSGQFLDTAIRDEYHTIESTLDDIRRLDIPIVFLVAEKDAWVKLGDVRLIYETLRSKNGNAAADMFLLEDCPHNYYEQSKTAVNAIKQIVVSCQRHLLGMERSASDVLAPPLRAVATQNAIEKRRLKEHLKASSGTELSFWDEYLSSYYILAKSPDYRGYLDKIADLIGGCEDGDCILDAGCGTGHLGSHLLARYCARTDPKPVNSIHYCGVDFVEKILQTTQRTHKEILETIRSINKACRIELSYKLADLQLRIDYSDNTFNKICLSLVVSYIDDPLSTIRDMRRILVPGGRLVVSSLKPHCDLSEIYKTFIAHAGSEAEVVEARNLLSNAGIIKQKESAGFYKFYSEQELKGLLLSLGFKSIQTYRAFGNQANIAVGVK